MTHLSCNAGITTEPPRRAAQTAYTGGFMLWIVRTADGARVLPSCAALQLCCNGDIVPPTSCHDMRRVSPCRRLQRLQTSHCGRLALLQQPAQRAAPRQRLGAAPTAEAAVAEKAEDTQQQEAAR